MKLLLTTTLIFTFYPYISQGKSLKFYKHVDKEGIVHYSSKKPRVKNFNVIYVKCPECKWKNKVNWHTTPLIKNKFLSEITNAANKWKVDSALIKAVIHAESGFKADVSSSAGAQGLMQLMPSTQKIYSVKNPYNAKQNIIAGTAYLKHLLKTYNKNLDLSLAAYNAGEGAVKKYKNKVPPYEETKNYIKRVKILYKRYKKS